MSHTCHWPGCEEEVPPSLWGCRHHWFLLPRKLRQRIWRTYRPGQEKDKQPSKAYIEAAQAAQDWIQSRYPIPEMKIA